jgi:hypothetical protein
VEYNKGKLNPKSFEIDVDGEDLSLFVGKHKIFGQGQIDLATDCQKIMIKRFTGKQVRNDFDLTGTFMFLPYGDLVLSGEAFGAENFFRLQLLPEERANFGWQLSTALSSFEIFGVVTDIKNLSFAVQLDGTLDLSEWDRGFSVHVGEPALVSMDVSADKLKGKVTFDGKLYGKASQPENWAGNLGLSFSDFSVYNIMPLDFVLNMTANKGTFQALIPTTPIYKGTCFGSLKLNAQKWGAELDLQNADIAYLYEINPGLKGLKGNFSAKLVLVGGWGDRNSVVGGGYLILKNGDLRKVAFISDAEEGIGKVVKGFSMPNFEKIEGNFDIKNGQVIFENIFCRASDLSIEISGKTSFDGTVNAVAGVRMFGGSTLKTLRQIILPVTIGFDLVANSIQINIKGKIPDLSQTTQVMPMNWLGEFFNLNYKADPNRYSLDKLWQ